ncbi:hypothetical protein [Agathobaculum sp. Marseille-P7918]|uniref:hypothetical protein n=1 Tax=Agathobaculum sp. Marseille-P7918 TaxID=2479843 RepID=UPI000F6437E5|nr:hypothetical protein [Agathobaculum sp. Marseille-P7918]
MLLYYEESPHLADVTKELIICYEGEPYKAISGTLGSVMINNYVEDVRSAVNEYYGVYMLHICPEYQLIDGRKIVTNSMNIR